MTVIMMIDKMLIILLLMPNFSIAAPNMAKRAAGPCIGMDCLHGVLMHNDEGVGDNHKHEDAEKLREELEENKKVKGPCEGMDCMHELMHNDNEDPLAKHKPKSGPEEQPKQQGPCEGMDCMHQVLMHDEEEKGKAHKHDEDKKKDVAEGDPSSQHDGPCLDCLHDVMMHGEDEAGKHHNNDNDAEDTMSDTDPQQKGPCIGMDCMHGVLMHNDEEQGNDHQNDDEEIQKDADDDGKYPSVADPHEMIHGTHDIDNQDYLKWKQENDKKTELETLKELEKDIQGYSYPFVSDTVLSDVELMKKRYFAKQGEEEDGEIVEMSQELDKEAGLPIHGMDMRHDLENIGSSDPIKIHHDES
ncbi:unnamed protein product [Owenia fusiformis]|uniref:Uncharacterized protein n=1 Tax=Owenia fusiformis TaxID=6347 RepID=A0A8J1TDQ3_OWEFU|nr:unnamed protein product [Owenia fusiformis]